MLTVLALVGALAVLFVAAAVATHEGDVLRDAPRDAADLDLPDGPLQPEDVADVRLGLALRGYRMDEVDHLLERVVADLVARGGRVRELEAALAAVTDRQQRAIDLLDATVEAERNDATVAVRDTDLAEAERNDATVAVRDADLAEAERNDATVAVRDADLAEARHRSREAAAELEAQSVVAPPLAGRGRFLGIRVRTTEGERTDRRPADSGTADRGTADRGAADRGAAGSGTADSGTPDTPTSDCPVAGERAVPGEEHHSAPDRVGGDSSRP